MSYSRYPNVPLIPVTNTDLSSGVGGIYKGSGDVTGNTEATINDKATLNFLLATGSTFKITDGRSSGNRVGLQYDADYSADFTDRSLVDKGYVTSMVQTIYNADGTINSNRTVSISDTYNLIFLNASNSNELLKLTTTGDTVQIGVEDDGKSKFRVYSSSETLEKGIRMDFDVLSGSVKVDILMLNHIPTTSYANGSMFLACRYDTALICGIDMEGGFQPAKLSNTVGLNNSIYYSTDNSKLVYKDEGGTVNELY